jgi:hypothetical protein
MANIGAPNLIHILVNGCYQSRQSHWCDNGPHHSQVIRDPTCTAVVSFRWATVLPIPENLHLSLRMQQDKRPKSKLLVSCHAALQPPMAPDALQNAPLVGHSCTNTSRSPFLPSPLSSFASPSLFNVTDTFRLQYSLYWNLPPSEPCTIRP